MGDVEADGLTVLRLHIVEYDGFAMTDDQFGEHTLHLRSLLHRGDVLHHLRLCCRLLLCLRVACRIWEAVLAVIAYEIVQGVDERSLVNAHSHGAVVEVSVAQHLIGDERYASYYGIDGFRPFQRVALVLEQKVCLELYEVGLMFLYVLTEVGCRMLA